jgi:hypothetical protein
MDPALLLKLTAFESWNTRVWNALEAAPALNACALCVAEMMIPVVVPPADVEWLPTEIIPAPMKLSDLTS